VQKKSFTVRFFAQRDDVLDAVHDPEKGSALVGSGTHDEVARTAGSALRQPRRRLQCQGQGRRSLWASTEPASTNSVPAPTRMASSGAAKQFSVASGRENFGQPRRDTLLRTGSTIAISLGPKPSADRSIANDRATGASDGSTPVAVVASRFVAAALDGVEAAAFAHGRRRR